ncbi:MAG: GDP-mannose-dependent alpha-(1-6)-phosphatidylinositol monomannoside mannosyltransferase [Frankiales bacterium]|nr:GDP-mannose-dependent alpha-(1-6)-phosphatidylinositol monomannoside mannosyltransferase [Frankiales bacterium]
MSRSGCCRCTPSALMPDIVLGVFTPVLGHLSETFVQRHLTDLVEDARAFAWEIAAAAAWSVPDPVLLPRPRQLGRLGRRLTREPGARAGYRLSREDSAAVVRSVREAGVTHVLLEYLDPWVPYLPALRATGVKVYAHGHGYDVSARLRQPWVARSYKAYANVDGVVVVSRDSAAKLREIGIPGSRIHVIPCGADVPAATPVRSPLGSGSWLTVGRMVPKKGPLHAVRAFAQAAEDCSAQLEMVGDGPLLEEVRATVAELGISDRVVLHGRCDHDTVQRLLSGALGLLHHSVTDPVSGDEEGLPVAILEAMAAGLPVVSTRHAGIPDAVEDGVTGLLADEADIATASAHLVRLSTDVALNREMGVAGWRKARDGFSIDCERERLLALMGSS